MSGCIPCRLRPRWSAIVLAASTVLLAALPGIADDTDPFARWESTISDFERQDAEHPPQPGGVLFVGSSSIRLWDLQTSFPDLDCVNRGFGGSEVADSLHFAPRIIFPHRPRVIVLYAGDNDIAREKTPCRVYEDFLAFAGVVREELPETRVLYLSIKPSLQRWGLIHRMRAANALIKAACEEDELLEFIDVESVMLDEQGLPREDMFIEDGLHLNESGYAAWTELLRPYLETPTEE